MGLKNLSDEKLGDFIKDPQTFMKDPENFRVVMGLDDPDVKARLEQKKKELEPERLAFLKTQAGSSIA